MSKKRRKLRAMTNGEFCRKWKKEHTDCSDNRSFVVCPFYYRMDCASKAFKAKPFKTNEGKYLLVEVQE